MYILYEVKSVKSSKNPYTNDKLNIKSYSMFGIQLNTINYINNILFFNRMCAMFLPEIASFAAAMLFAVHPIHTEAVSTTYCFPCYLYHNCYVLLI